MIDERIYEGVFRWFGHVERMENDRIAKRVDVGGLLEEKRFGWQASKENGPG